MPSILAKSFYGWWIVAGAVATQFAWMAVGPAVAGVFLGPIVNDLQWDVWQFTLGVSLAAVASAFSGIVAGEIVDRRGPRSLMLFGMAVTVVCFASLAIQSSLWIFLMLHMLLGLVGWTLFGPLIVNATISKWFVAQRGWALSIGSIGVSLGGIISPVTFTFIVDGWGWRVGYAALAVFVFALVTPVAFLMRRTPEDYGILPDGGRGKAQGASGEGNTAELPSLTRAQALRTRGFWLLTCGFGLNFIALGSVLVHAIPFATDAGFSRPLAAAGLAVNGLGNLSSKVVWGWGLQNIETRKLVIAAYSVSSVGVALIVAAASVGQAALLMLGFFLYGFGFGGTIPISEFLWARYFGRKHIGAIRGIGNPIAILGTAIGPVAVGMWFDATGAYSYAFIALIGAYMSGAALVGISREPSRG